MYNNRKQETLPFRSQADRAQSKKFEMHIHKNRSKKLSFAKKKRGIESWKISKSEFESALEHILSQHAGHYLSVNIEDFSLNAIKSMQGAESDYDLAELNLVARLTTISEIADETSNG